MLGQLNTTIDILVKSIGYIPNYHKGKINETVLQQLNYLVHEKYITTSISLDVVKPKECFTISINGENNIFDMSTGKNETKPFVMLTYHEFEVITQTKTTSDKGILIKAFLHIKKRINLNNYSEQFTYCSQELLSKECGTSRGYSIQTPINDLVSIGVLYEYTTGSYTDLNGTKRNAPNIYILLKMTKM